MKKSGKTFIALILTYSIKRTGSYITNFEPLMNFPGFVGIVIDITIWILLFYAVLWIIDAMVKTKEGQ